MPATTGLDLVTNALVTLGVYAPGVTLQAKDSSQGLRRLNNMMGALSLQPLTQPVLARDVFTLTANKGGPSNPYTIGTGGDFDTTRPTALMGASILLVQTDPLQNVEVGVSVITDEAWQGIAIKDLRAAQFTDVFYNPTYASDLGTINLWPVPNITTNSLVLYQLVRLTSFANLTTSYFLPDGCEEALEYNLARRLITPYSITDQQTVEDVKELARTTLGNFKRSNNRPVDLATDPALTHNRAGGYNIVTGTGGGG